MKPSVVTCLQGGLGNQLFQYFAGYWLAKNRDAELRIDLSFFSKQSKRAYQLDQFKIPSQFFSPVQRKLVSLSLSRWTRHAARSLLPRGLQYKLVDETPTKPIESYVGVDTSIVLRGYWQDYRHLESIRSDISRLLAPQKSLSVEADRWNLKIAAHEHPVAVHIRRGDYVSEPQTNAVHGVCGLEYFSEAMRQIEDKLPGAHFFLFSDDIEWIRENFRGKDNTTLVTYESPQHDVEDFELMRACRHFVISNSSYSWWPAWLGDHSTKIVVAPLNWFANGTESKQVPPNWIRL